MTDIYPEITVSARRDASSSMRYDYYLQDSTREIFKDGSKPLKEFLKMRSMVAKPPCNSKREGALILAGEKYDSTERVATEFGKKYTRSMLKCLWQNEQNDESFADFTAENMFASKSGRAKFYGVARIKHTGVQAKRNHNSAYDIISALFSKGGRVPEDIQRLLELIKGYPAKSGLYHIHASLLPLSKRQPALLKMYEQLAFKMKPYEQREILLKLPYINEWKTRLESNRLLERIYCFKPKMYDVFEPLEDEQNLTFEEKMEKGRKRKWEESVNMVKYMRNRTAHRMDDVKKEEDLGQPLYSAEDAELVALVHYPMTLPCLQEELYDAGELESLQMDDMF